MVGVFGARNNPGYLEVRYDDLRALGACEEWRANWRKQFGRDRVVIAPRMLASLFDDGYPVSWYMTEAFYLTRIDDDYQAGRRMQIALLADTRRRAVAINPEWAGVWDAMAAAIAEKLRSGSYQNHNVGYMHLLHEVDEWKQPELFVYNIMAACDSDGLGRVPEAIETLKAECADLLGSCVTLPRTMLEIARYSHEQRDTVERHIANMRDNRRGED